METQQEATMDMDARLAELLEEWDYIRTFQNFVRGWDGDKAFRAGYELDARDISTDDFIENAQDNLVAEASDILGLTADEAAAMLLDRPVLRPAARKGGC
jgi:hypothetical protein